MGKAVLNVSRQTQTGEDVNASKSLPSSPLDGNKVKNSVNYFLDDQGFLSTV